MLVLCLSNCPPSLRGDLTRWLQEIDTGVYAGHVSARVRDELWERTVANIKDGRATMVFSVRNEQRMDFRVHNTEWTPIDFDGMKLMLRPHRNAVNAKNAEPGKNFSSTAAVRNAKKFGGRGRPSQERPVCYAVVDVETTGLSAVSDRMIEIGALKVENGAVTDRFEMLVKCETPLPEAIRELTGMTDAMLAENGVDEADALLAFLAFVEDLPLVMHNAGFDLNFLRQACRRCSLPMPTGDITDTVALAKRTIDDIEDFKLRTIAAWFNIEVPARHRSVDDCLLTKQIYEKLIEKTDVKA